jgi:hypothetical protein
MIRTLYAVDCIYQTSARVHSHIPRTPLYCVMSHISRTGTHWEEPEISSYDPRHHASATHSTEPHYRPAVRYNAPIPFDDSTPYADPYNETDPLKYLDTPWPPATREAKHPVFTHIVAPPVNSTTLLPPPKDSIRLQLYARTGIPDSYVYPDPSPMDETYQFAIESDVPSLAGFKGMYQLWSAAAQQWVNMRTVPFVFANTSIDTAYVDKGERITTQAHVSPTLVPPAQAYTSKSTH